MCRWITFISTEEMFLSDLVLKPSNSLVDQAIDASFHPGFAQRFNHQVNADGFGVGWYHSGGPNPALFKDTEPAWSNVNLIEICNATKSKCVIAHVRAASPGMGIHAGNCHPFKAGRLLFAHNGAIKGFSRIKRKLMAQLTDEAFLSIKGTTDSETCFALLLTNLAKDGYAPKGVSPFEQTEPFGHDRLYSAVKRTIRQLEHILKITGIQEEEVDPSRMNFTLTDGETIICSRFCDKYPEVPPPSLYFAYGDAKQMQLELCDEENKSVDESHHHSDNGSAIDDDGEDDIQDAVEKDLSFQQSLPGKLLKEVDPSSCAFIVSSDPLTKTSSEISWHRVAANSILCYTRGSIPRLYHLNVGGAKRPEDFAFFLVDF
ncbi:glutaminyl-tRNA synthetase [Nitzschia inconspicua]|uniref:Glutaminyl-tRNA synthetase n=1 Tax=Nitzschia inconspicua TaxID=303405 RepID=A0A9K3LCL4_9STRA|nr:glutaminyl-tRNA synthetase [Nitzschia inconspicua]